jgi:hypothetical protein
LSLWACPCMIRLSNCPDHGRGRQERSKAVIPSLAAISCMIAADFAVRGPDQLLTNRTYISR